MSTFTLTQYTTDIPSNIDIIQPRNYNKEDTVHIHIIDDECKKAKPIIVDLDGQSIECIESDYPFLIIKNGHLNILNVPFHKTFHKNNQYRYPLTQNAVIETYIFKRERCICECKINYDLVMQDIPNKIVYDRTNQFSKLPCLYHDGVYYFVEDNTNVKETFEKGLIRCIGTSYIQDLVLKGVL